jgi:hypothetical protein
MMSLQKVTASPLSPRCHCEGQSPEAISAAAKVMAAKRTYADFAYFLQ